jgi:hypothetical protein
MPRYSCKSVLQEKLKYAIHFCKSIDTDDYARVALTGEMIGEIYELSGKKWSGGLYLSSTCNNKIQFKL